MHTVFAVVAELTMIQITTICTISAVIYFVAVVTIGSICGLRYEVTVFTAAHSIYEFTVLGCHRTDDVSKWKFVIQLSELFKNRPIKTHVSSVLPRVP